MSYRVSGRRVPAVHQPADPIRAQREATEAARLAAGALAPAPTPRPMFDDVALARERARRPRSKRSRQRAKALTVRTSHAMFSILRRLAATTGTSANELVNAAVLTAYARAS